MTEPLTAKKLSDMTDELLKDAPWRSINGCIIVNDRFIVDPVGEKVKDRIRKRGYFKLAEDEAVADLGKWWK